MSAEETDSSSVDAFKWALRDDRSLAARYGRDAANIKLLLCMLMLRYPNIRPSGPTIMADCGWADERTLTRIKKLAVESGWLEVVHKGTGPGDSSVYRLRIPELPASNAGTSDAGTSNVGTSNAAELPAFRAENYPHGMGVQDPIEDPIEDTKARASGASGVVLPDDSRDSLPARMDDAKARYEAALRAVTQSLMASDDHYEEHQAIRTAQQKVSHLGGWKAKAKFLEDYVA